jgi:uncharacterized protein (AIM24 family)
MKSKITLPTGVLGVTFTGTPATVRSVSGDSPLSTFIPVGSIVTEVIIPDELEIRGRTIPYTAIVTLLKKYMRTEGRTITFEEPTELGNDVPEFTEWRLKLPNGSIGLSFKDTTGLPELIKVSDASPLKHKVVEGTYAKTLSIEGIGEFSGVNATNLVQLLKTNAKVKERVLIMTDQQSMEVKPRSVSSNETYDFCGSAEIEGGEAQVIVVHLRQGDQVVSHSDAMVYMTDGIEFDGVPATEEASRTGEVDTVMSMQTNLVTWHYHPQGADYDKEAGKIAFSPSFPSKIFCIDVGEYGGRIIAERSSFVVGDARLRVTIFMPSSGPNMFGGDNIVMQKFEGSGKIFLSGQGQLTKLEMKEGESLRVYSNTIVALQWGINYKVERVIGLRSNSFTEDGVFVSTLTGPGTVWLETQPWSRTIATIAIYALS